MWTAAVSAVEECLGLLGQGCRSQRQSYVRSWPKLTLPLFDAAPPPEKVDRKRRRAPA
jgi:hypothetical protein